MKVQRGPLPEDKDNGNDNLRIRRYVAKYTINPALAHGMGHKVGSVEVCSLPLLKIGLLECTNRPRPVLLVRS